MSRRNLGITLATGGALGGALILVLGLVLKNQADFAASSVKEARGRQKMYFTASDNLTGQERS